MSWENDNRKSRDAKTLQVSELLAVAYCGSGRLGQILQFHMQALEDPPLGRDEQRWAVREFVPFLRDVTASQGWLHQRLEDNVEELGESAFLFAVRGRLFAVEADFSVSEHRYGFEALGSGMSTAIGTLHHAAGKPSYDPYPPAKAKRMVAAAVLAATEYTNFVGGDITYAETVLYTDEELVLAREMARRRR